MIFRPTSEYGAEGGRRHAPFPDFPCKDWPDERRAKLTWLGSEPSYFLLSIVSVAPFVGVIRFVARGWTVIRTTKKGSVQQLPHVVCKDEAGPGSGLGPHFGGCMPAAGLGRSWLWSTSLIMNKSGQGRQVVIFSISLQGLRPC